MRSRSFPPPALEWRGEGHAICTAAVLERIRFVPSNPPSGGGVGATLPAPRPYRHRSIPFPPPALGWRGRGHAACTPAARRRIRLLPVLLLLSCPEAAGLCGDRVSLRAGREAARDCSHGWSAAQPVESVIVTCSPSAPEGRRSVPQPTPACCISPSPLRGERMKGHSLHGFGDPERTVAEPVATILGRFAADAIRSFPPHNTSRLQADTRRHTEEIDPNSR
jgi:hypothetical protein